MFSLKWSAPFGFAAILAGATAVVAAPPASTVISSIDLSGPFGARSPWRFTASQSPSVDDPFGEDGTAPGRIVLCLTKSKTGRCDTSLRAVLGEDTFADPHFLNKVRIVHPQGISGHALLFVQTASLFSGDGNQSILTQALAYDRASDRFTRVYEFLTGRNNNEEVRYVEVGPLKGAIISAEPTADAPFAFWVTVNAITPAYTFRQVLHYRSATRYDDGNPLAVIDSEMPNIEKRLGLWRRGLPLPLPASACPRPRLVRMELWCDLGRTVPAEGTALVR